MAVGEEGPLFLSSFDFETEGSRLSLTFKRGSTAYQFLVPFKAVYPLKWKNKGKKSTLESLLNEKGISKSTSFDTGKKEYFLHKTFDGAQVLFMDKTEFSRLPKNVRELFDTNYTQSFMWDFGYLRKATFEPWLEELLTEKNKLDDRFKTLHNSTYSVNRAKYDDPFSLEFIQDNYASQTFEEDIVKLALKEMGYVIKEDDLEKVQHLFKKTKYSLSNLEELADSEIDCFGPLGAEYRKKDEILQNKDYYSEYTQLKFSDRFFISTSRIFGKRGLSNVSKTSYDYVQKDKQHYILNKLKGLLRAREKYLADEEQGEEYSRDIKYQLEELFSFIHDRAAESRTEKDLKRMFKGKEVGSDFMPFMKEAELIESKRKSLEERILPLGNSSIDYDFSHQRMRLLLDIMHREAPHRIRFNGFTKSSQLTIDEYMRTVLALMDIEQPQYGSIKEKIEDIATIVKTSSGELIGQIDTLRELPVGEINGFGVKTHKYVKDEVASSAEFLNTHGASTVMTYGTYDFKHTKATEKYTLSSGGSKEMLPRKRVHVNFMERYEIPGTAINLLNLMSSYLPQFPKHKLGIIMSHLERKAGVPNKFAKIFTHDELRRADKEVERLMSTGLEEDRQAALEISCKIGVYTVDDVKELFQVLIHPNNKWIFEDLFDISNAFGITLDQASTNRGTTINALGRRQYALHGTFANDLRHTPEYQKTHSKTREAYKSKKKELLAQTFENEKGLFEGVTKFYYAPELGSAELFIGFPLIQEYIRKTLTLDDDRKIARLNFIKSIVQHMRTDIARIDQELNEKKAWKKKWFFERIYGITSESANEIMELAYANTVARLSELNPIQVEGDFIYAKTNERPLPMGLENITLYSMRQDEFVYLFNGKYSKLPGSIEDSGFTKTRFELELTRDLLDNIFQRDLVGALNTARTAYEALHNVENDKSIAQKLLLFNRTKNRYYGVIGRVGNKLLTAEFTPDAKKSFEPDIEYYTGEYSDYLFGVSKRHVDVNAKVPMLLSGIFKMGENNDHANVRLFSLQRRMYANEIMHGITYDQESYYRLREKGQLELF